jgi:hypothetical protein
MKKQILPFGFAQGQDDKSKKTTTGILSDGTAQNDGGGGETAVLGETAIV